MDFFFMLTNRRRDEKSQKGHTAGDRRVSVSEYDRLLRRGHRPNTNVALLFTGMLSTPPPPPNDFSRVFFCRYLIRA